MRPPLSEHGMTINSERPAIDADRPFMPSLLSRRGLLVAGATTLAVPSWARGIVSGEEMAAIVDPDAALHTVHAGGRWVEGPAWDRRRGALVFSDVKRNAMLRIESGGRPAVWRDPSNNANGNAFDREGRLVTCEHLTRRVVRQEADGRMTVLADRFEGRALNSPNDAIVAADGAIWFTDPVFGITVPDEGLRAEPEQRGRFVFRIDPSGTLAVASDGFDQPNGLVFSPDGRTLYVSETGAALNPEGPREIHAFDVIDGRRLARQRVFARLDQGIADGLTVDHDGRLYAATAQGAAVWTPGGERLGTIATPATCGNLAFGGADGRRLFLCATDMVHAIDLKTKGWR